MADEITHRKRHTNCYDWTNIRLHTEKDTPIVMTGPIQDCTQKKTHQLLRLDQYKIAHRKRHTNCYDWTNTRLHTAKDTPIVMTGPIQDCTRQKTHQLL